MIKDVPSCWIQQTYRRLFSAVQVVCVTTQRTATVQLDIEFVVVTPSPVDVDTQRIVSET